MKAEKLKELLREKLEQIPSLKEKGRESRDFKQWRLETEIFLQKFDKKRSTSYAEKFSSYHFRSMVLYSWMSESDHREAFLRDLDEVDILLTTIISMDKEFCYKNFWEQIPFWWIYQLYRRVDLLFSKIVWLEDNPKWKLVASSASIIGFIIGIISLILYFV